jgi:hypothetical protein
MKSELHENAKMTTKNIKETHTSLTYQFFTKKKKLTYQLPQETHKIENYDQTHHNLSQQKLPREKIASHHQQGYSKHFRSRE